MFAFFDSLLEYVRIGVNYIVDLFQIICSGFVFMFEGASMLFAFVELAPEVIQFALFFVLIFSLFYFILGR